MRTSIAFVVVALMHGELVSTINAQDEKPLHLVISEVGDRLTTFELENGKQFTLSSEIQGKLNFGMRGDFKNAEFVSGSAVAPDGKTYELKALGVQPAAFPGGLLRFLSVTFGNAHTDFSIGKWSVTVDFKIDGVEYTFEADYHITWRKPNDGALGEKLWVNKSEAEQGGAGQPATAPESKPEGVENHKPESEPAPR